MAYDQPVRFLYHGDKVVALRYVREARRQIENMLARLPRKLPAGRRIFEYEGGVIIEVIIADRQVTAIIRAPKIPVRIPRPFDDFVVVPRSASWPDGTDPAHPQMILRAPERAGPWRTFFFDQSNPLYTNFGGSKGTYKNGRQAEPLFPDGITHAGNIDWRGPNGERISWYGPDSRYFYDTYRQPSAQYGRFVFNLGQVLFDVDKYCLDNDQNWDARLVVGACLREHDDGLWLYMMMAEMSDVVTPVQTIPAFEVYFSENFPFYDVQFALRRVRLTLDRDTTEAMKWKPIDGTAEQLWNPTAFRACNPWVFSTDGTKLTTFALSDSPVFLFLDTDSTQLGNTPPASMNRIDVDLTTPTAPTFVLTEPSIPAGTGAAAMALDYDDAGQPVEIRLSREAFSQSAHALVIRMGGFAYPVWFASPSGAPSGTRNVRRRLAWADAREQFAVFEENILSMTDSSYSEEFATVIFYRGMEVARRVHQTYTGGATTDPTMGALEACSSVPVAPLAFMWMLVANTFGSTVRATLEGLTSAQVHQPFVPAETFGQFGARANAPGPSTPIASFADAGFANNLTDNHDHRQSYGAAAREGVLLFSGWFNDGVPGPQDQSLAYATKASLAALTGVGDTNARYHPIWLMGQPIGGGDAAIATP